MGEERRKEGKTGGDTQTEGNGSGDWVWFLCCVSLSLCGCFVLLEGKWVVCQGG